MPRPTQSAEGKILGWFRTAPLGEARLLLGLVKDAMQERGRTPVSPKPRTRVQSVIDDTDVTPPAATSTTSKRSRHKRARPANGGEGAEIESFGG